MPSQAHQKQPTRRWDFFLILLCSFLVKGLLRGHEDSELETKKCLLRSTYQKEGGAWFQGRKEGICNLEPSNRDSGQHTGKFGVVAKSSGWEAGGKEEAPEILGCSSIPELALAGFMLATLMSLPNPPTLWLEFRVKNELKEGKKEVKGKAK